MKLDISDSAAIIQTRISSTRLPGKSIMKIAGKSMLSRIIARLSPLFGRDGIVVATTNKECDNSIVDEAVKLDVKVYRGDEDNVLKRYIDASCRYDIEVIARVTADNPFVDILHMDKAVRLLIEDKLDYVSFLGLPLGISSEIVTVQALKKVSSLTDAKLHQEHVTSFIYTNPSDFKMHLLKPIEPFFKRPEIRLTVDTMEDLLFVSSIYEKLGDNPALRDIINLLDNEPALMKINSHIVQKSLSSDNALK